MSKVYIGLDRSQSYRVYLTDSTELVQEAQDIHGTSPLATAGLGRVLTAAGLLGLQLKEEANSALFEQQALEEECRQERRPSISLLFRGDGPVEQILAVGRADGSVKGYIAHPEVELPLKENGKLDVGGSLGEGELTVIRDLGLKEPWSGTIPFVSGEIAEDLTAYYYVSEQQNTSLALGVKIGIDGRVAAAGGLFIQLLPQAEEGAIAGLEQLTKEMLPLTEYVSRERESEALASGEQGTAESEEAPRLEKMVREIFASMDPAYRPEFLEYRDIRWACDCSREKMASALATIGVKDLTELAEEDHGAELTCQFCESRYRFSEEELREMIAEGRREAAARASERRQ